MRHRFETGDLAFSPITATLGLQITTIEKGRARGTVKFDPKFANPAKVMQGGIISAILDDVMGFAVASTMSLDETGTGLELKTSFFGAVREGEYTAEGYIQKRGKRIVFTEATLTDSEGNLVAKASSTFALIKREALTKSP
jgi:uncharacterized protein (TIGR00369 family)